MIKKAHKRDIKGLIEVESATFGSDDYPLSIGSFYYHVANNSLYVYKIDNRVIGYILWLKRKHYFRLYSISVLAEFSGQGIAKELMEYSFENLKASQYTLEVKCTNIRAIRFYEKFGFKTIKTLKDFYPNNKDGYFMKKVV